VLQSQLQVLAHSGSTDGGCVKLGGGSVKTLSSVKTSPKIIDSTVDIYFDTACQHPYIEAVATVTGSADVASVTETATYLGLQGQTLGSLSLSESATDSTKKKSLVLIGLGHFTPQNGAPVVDLGLTCTFRDSKAMTVPCEGGVAQDFPALNLSLASVTPLVLTGTKTGKVTSINFAGKTSDMQTDAAGSLSITTPTASSLGIGGGGTAYGSAVTKGHAARFELFPPTPTHWTIVDKTHDAKFSLQVVSNATRDVKATVTTISSGATLATITADQSGTGSIAYSDGTTAAITSWLLAD
jgi:hypothetical protein